MAASLPLPSVHSDLVWCDSNLLLPPNWMQGPGENFQALPQPRYNCEGFCWLIVFGFTVGVVMVLIFI